MILHQKVVKYATTSVCPQNSNSISKTLHEFKLTRMYMYLFVWILSCRYYCRVYAIVLLSIKIVINRKIKTFNYVKNLTFYVWTQYRYYYCIVHIWLRLSGLSRGGIVWYFFCSYTLCFKSSIICSIWIGKTTDDDQYFKCYSLHVQMPVHKDSHIYHTNIFNINNKWNTKKKLRRVFDVVSEV